LLILMTSTTLRKLLIQIKACLRIMFKTITNKFLRNKRNLILITQNNKVTPAHEKLAATEAPQLASPLLLHLLCLKRGDLYNSRRTISLQLKSWPKQTIACLQMSSLIKLKSINPREKGLLKVTNQMYQKLLPNLKTAQRFIM